MAVQQGSWDVLLADSVDTMDDGTLDRLRGVGTKSEDDSIVASDA